ncbi:hypothetical protein [Nocardia anaemiae]|uniref:hypothetical protein n=1 Tax=Nocardia anaemiae TaxID=263910 RepID=UPI0012F4C425|nr:hypothetical protein [Nocardia anaemiae]
MTPIVAAVITALGIHGIAFGGLWIRLRWQTKQQRVHRRYIVALAHSLPRGSRIDDLHGNGRRTRLTIGSTSKETDD